jgi:hypothetical protein
MGLKPGYGRLRKATASPSHRWPWDKSLSTVSCYHHHHHHHDHHHDHHHNSNLFVFRAHVHIYQTRFLEPIPSWEAGSRSSTQDTRNISWYTVCVQMCTALLPPGVNPIVVKYIYHISMSGHFQVHNSQSLAYILSQLNPVHALPL